MLCDASEEVRNAALRGVAAHHFIQEDIEKNREDCIRKMEGTIMKLYWLLARLMFEVCLCHRWRLESNPIMVLFPLIPVFPAVLHLFSIFAYEKNPTFLVTKKTVIELINLKMSVALPIQNFMFLPSFFCTQQRKILYIKIID